MSKFVRIPARDFPGRPLHVDRYREGIVAPLRMVGTICGHQVEFIQGQPFKEVPADVAEWCAKEAFFSASPLHPTKNPPKFDVVATREEAERLDFELQSRVTLLMQT